MKISKPNFCIQWHITNNCSQRCKHCYLSQQDGNPNPQQKLTIEEMSVVVNDVFATAKILKANAFFVLTGGDPLLHPDFWKLLNVINNSSKKFSIKCIIDILGNPFLVNKQTVGRLKASGVRKFQLSLDGLETKHDILRSSGCFQKTFDAMRILKQAKIRTTCMFTLSKFNAPDLISVMRKVAKEGFDAFAFARFCRPSDWSLSEYKKQMFTPLEYKALLTEVDLVHQELLKTHPKTKFVLKDHLWELFFYERHSQKQHTELKKTEQQKIIMDGCSLGITGPSILADGTVYACRRFHSPIGKVPDQEMMDLFIDSPQLNYFRDITKYKKCGSCPLLYSCRGCGAVAYSYSGLFFDPDPQCWYDIPN